MKCQGRNLEVYNVLKAFLNNNAPYSTAMLSWEISEVHNTFCWLPWPQNGLCKPLKVASAQTGKLQPQSGSCFWGPFWGIWRPIDYSMTWTRAPGHFDKASQKYQEHHVGTCAQNHRLWNTDLLYRSKRPRYMKNQQLPHGSAHIVQPWWNVLLEVKLITEFGPRSHDTSGGTQNVSDMTYYQTQ